MTIFRLPYFGVAQILDHGNAAIANGNNPGQECSWSFTSHGLDGQPSRHA